MARTNVCNCLSEEVLLWYFLVRGMVGERLVKLLFADLVLLEKLRYFINQLCAPKTKPEISRWSDCWTASQGFLNSLPVSSVDSCCGSQQPPLALVSSLGKASKSYQSFLNQLLHMNKLFNLTSFSGT